MLERFFSLIWSIFAIVMGGLGAFGPPEIIRGYSNVENDPVRKERLVTLSRTTGWVFFILGHIGIGLTIVNSLVYQDFLRLLMSVVIIVADLIILVKLKIVKSLPSLKSIHNTLLIICLWVAVNATVYYLVSNIVSMQQWVIFMIIQITLAVFLGLLRLFNKLS
jgi:hypothetical protein